MSLSETRDINNDGLKEIIVSASGFRDTNLNQYGAFYILNLNFNGTVNSFTKFANGLQNLNVNSEDGDGFAMSVADSNMSYSSDFKFIIESYFDIENTTEFQRGSFYVISLGTNLSIQNNTNNKITVYPNPTSSKVYISNDDDIQKIEVYDVLERKITDIKKDFKIIDFSYMPIGNYVMKILYFNNRAETVKLLKE